MTKLTAEIKDSEQRHHKALTELKDRYEKDLEIISIEQVSSEYLSGVFARTMSNLLAQTHNDLDRHKTNLTKLQSNQEAIASKLKADFSNQLAQEKTVLKERADNADNLYLKVLELEA